MNKRTLRFVLAAGLLCGVVLAIGTAALSGMFVSDGYHASSGVTYNSTDGVAVTLSQNRTVANGTPFPDSNTVELGNGTFSSSADTHLRIQSLSGDYVSFDQINASTADVRINTTDHQAVEVGGEINYVEYRNVNAQPVADGNRDLTYRGTDGTTTRLTIENLPAGEKVRAVDLNSGAVLDIARVDSNGTATFSSLPNSEHNVDVQTKDGGDPVVENPSPDDTEISDRDANLTVDVSDSDFPNDTVSVEFYLDGSLVDTQSIGSNQTVSTEVTNLSSGDHNWSVVAEDEYGGRDVGNFTFQVPDELRIYNETAPDQLIDDREVTVQFFVDGGDEVIVRNTTDGTVNLTGLPVNEDYVIVAETQGYYNRHIVIQSLADQQSIYMLNESANSVEVRFTLDDATGRFDEETTTLYVQKPITVNGTTTYQTVAADEFGVQGFTTNLEDGARYRLIVENDQGDTRVLGSYTASVSETVELQIGSVDFQAGDASDEYVWDAAFVNESGSERIEFDFQDREDLTDEITVTIYERGNESNVIYSETHNGPYGNLSITQPLSNAQANKTWVVEWEADRDGQTINGSKVVGGTIPATNALDETWLTFGSVALLIILGGLFGGVRAELGAIVISLLSGVFWYIEFLPPEVGGGVIVLALFVSILYSVRVRGGAPA